VQDCQLSNAFIHLIHFGLRRPAPRNRPKFCFWARNLSNVSKFLRALRPRLTPTGHSRGHAERSDAIARARTLHNVIFRFVVVVRHHGDAVEAAEQPRTTAGDTRDCPRVRFHLQPLLTLRTLPPVTGASDKFIIELIRVGVIEAQLAVRRSACSRPFVIFPHPRRVPRTGFGHREPSQPLQTPGLVSVCSQWCPGHAGHESKRLKISTQIVIFRPTSPRPRTFAWPARSGWVCLERLPPALALLAPDVGVSAGRFAARGHATRRRQERRRKARRGAV